MAVKKTAAKPKTRAKAKAKPKKKNWQNVPKTAAFNKLTPKARGVSMGKDSKDYFCYTHRARSPSYATQEKIPVKMIEVIESTG